MEHFHDGPLITCVTKMPIEPISTSPSVFHSITSGVDPQLASTVLARLGGLVSLRVAGNEGRGGSGAVLLAPRLRKGRQGRRLQCQRRIPGDP